VDCIKKQCQKIKELQANNTDVDFIFISMDKTADKWKVGIEKHQLIGDHYMANDQMEGVCKGYRPRLTRYIIVDKTGEIAFISCNRNRF
jgi:hypothetical protein